MKKRHVRRGLVERSKSSSDSLFSACENNTIFRKQNNASQRWFLTLNYPFGIQPQVLPQIWRWWMHHDRLTQSFSFSGWAEAQLRFQGQNRFLNYLFGVRCHNQLKFRSFSAIQSSQVHHRHVHHETRYNFCYICLHDAQVISWNESCTWYSTQGGICCCRLNSSETEFFGPDIHGPQRMKLGYLFPVPVQERFLFGSWRTVESELSND